MVERMRSALRIGVVRPLSLNSNDESAYRKLVFTQNLLVEMQNALEADQSLFSVHDAYRLQKAAETHQRFLKSYVKMLVETTLPELWFTLGMNRTWLTEHTWLQQSLDNDLCLFTVDDAQRVFNNDRLLIETLKNLVIRCTVQYESPVIPHGLVRGTCNLMQLAVRRFRRLTVLNNRLT